MKVRGIPLPLSQSCRDWTRLLPRKEGTTNQERVAYLVDFLTHRRGSKISVSKAIKELAKLNQVNNS